jgi:hypothetical protein
VSLRCWLSRCSEAAGLCRLLDTPESPSYTSSSSLPRPHLSCRSSVHLSVEILVVGVAVTPDAGDATPRTHAPTKAFPGDKDTRDSRMKCSEVSFIGFLPRICLLPPVHFSVAPPFPPPDSAPSPSLTPHYSHPLPPIRPENTPMYLSVELRRPRSLPRVSPLRVSPHIPDT